MCGISGFYSKTLSNFDNAISKMNAAIYHRGPDSNNIWEDKNAGIFFGHQRLSILDLSSAGNQPMTSSSGRFVLTYNGEIYNHLEIRKKIEEINSEIKWRSETDTETLIEALEIWDVEKVLNEIVGMFAFAIWDKKNRSLILARDRMGEKPLYFGWQGKGESKAFLFASELKSLRAHPKFLGEIYSDAINLQLRHNYIPAPYSIYKDIQKLLPGHFLELKEYDLKKGMMPNSKAYWSLTENAIQLGKNEIETNQTNILKNFERHLKKSVKQQMISDVPLGAFLSGGIDSSTIVTMMQLQSSQPVKTFTIGFNEQDYNESKYAKKIADYLGTDHTELNISPKKAMDVIPKLPMIYDEPFSDSSQIPTFLVSQLAKTKVKVALSGDGGDELFCGYNRYVLTNSRFIKFRLIPLFLRKIIAFGIKSLSQNDWYRLFKLLPGINSHNNSGYKMHKGANALEANTLINLYYILCSQWQNPNEVVLNSKDPSTTLKNFNLNINELKNHEQMMTVDLLTYLPDDILVKVDRAAMASSLETRVPFLNHKLVEYAWKIPHSLKLKNDNGKWILKQILNQYIPKSLTERPKMGFGIPLHLWLRGPLREWAENLLDEKRLKQDGYFNPKLIRDKWNEHQNFKKNWQNELWSVLMFQAWIDANNK